MKLIAAEVHGTNGVVRIHTNEDKWVVDPNHPEVLEVLEDGSGRVAIVPDPAYVVERVHGLVLGDDKNPIDQQMQSAVDELARVVQDGIAEAKADEDLTSKLQLPALE